MNDLLVDEKWFVEPVENGNRVVYATATDVAGETRFCAWEFNDRALDRLGMDSVLSYLADMRRCLIRDCATPYPERRKA